MESTSQSVTAEVDKPDPGPVGLIGLGLMGMALAERLRGGGFEVCGRDVDPARESLLADSGGKVATNAPEIASACQASRKEVRKAKENGDLVCFRPERNSRTRR